VLAKWFFIDGALRCGPYRAGVKGSAVIKQSNDNYDDNNILKKALDRSKKKTIIKGQ